MIKKHSYNTASELEEVTQQYASLVPLSLSFPVFCHCSGFGPEVRFLKMSDLQFMFVNIWREKNNNKLLCPFSDCTGHNLNSYKVMEVVYGNQSDNHSNQYNATWPSRLLLVLANTLLPSQTRTSHTFAVLFVFSLRTGQTK